MISYMGDHKWGYNKYLSMGISITFYGYHQWDTIPQTKFSSQTSESWMKVHGQSCHSLSPTANSNSSDLGVQKPQTRNNPETIPNYTQYIAKKMGGIVHFLAVWLMIPLNGNPMVKKGLEPTLKWGIYRGPGEFRLTHGARTSLWSDLALEAMSIGNNSNLEGQTILGAEIA